MIKQSFQSITLLCLFLLGGCTEQNPTSSPTQLGRYSIGYTEFHACDDKRIEQVNDDPIFHNGPLKDCVRGVAVNNKIRVARPVGFRVWYPTDTKSGNIVSYSPNSDIYPNSGVMHTTLTIASPLGALRNTPIAHQASGFPLVIFSPGSGGTGVEFADGFVEILASHGFIIASLDHANDQYLGLQWGGAVGLYSYPKNGPYPFTGGGNESELISRIHDVKFSLDEMLRRNSDNNTILHGAIDANKIGLSSYSFGGPTIIGLTAGIASIGISPDPRIKALFIMDGTLFGNSKKNSHYAFNIHSSSPSDLKKITIPILIMYNTSTPDALRAFQDVGSKDASLVMLSNSAHISTATRYCLWLENILDHFSTATALDVFPPQHINSMGFKKDAPHLNLQDLLSLHTNLKTKKDLLENRAALNMINNSAYADNPYQHCSMSLFTAHPLSDAEKLLFGNSLLGIQPPPLGLNPPTGGTPSLYTMPLQMLDDELINAETFYTVAFFEAKLANHPEYNDYLTPEYANKKLPPFIKTWHNQFHVANHPLDLKPGDKISFKPVNQNHFEVSYSENNTMVTVDNLAKAVKIQDNVTTNQEMVTFQAGFPFLGTSFGNSHINNPYLTQFYGAATSINNINVYNSGMITLGLDRPLNVFSDINLAFQPDEVLIGSGVYRIAPFFADLVPNQAKSKISYQETADHRLIITWSNMSRYPYDEENINIGPAVITGPSTFQVILYGNGSINPGQIDFIYGKIDGKTNSPNRIIAVVGIAKGDTWKNYPIEAINNKMGTSVKFSELKQHPITLPLGAIYETFTQGITLNKARP